MNQSPVSLDLPNYFTNPNAVCTYISCDIVDNLGNPLSWITSAYLSGSSCIFNFTITQI